MKQSLNKNTILNSLLSFMCLLFLLFNGFHCSQSQITQSDAEEQSENKWLQDTKTERGMIGSKCKTNQQCKQNLFCEQRIPEGYCTNICKKSTECPIRSACVKITASDGQSFDRCVKTCKTDKDCRPKFHCYHPQQAWKQICLPKTK